MGRMIPIKSNVHVNPDNISSIEHDDVTGNTIVTMNNGKEFMTMVPRMEIIMILTGGQAKSVVYLFNPTSSVNNIAKTDIVFYDTAGPVHAETSIQLGVTMDIKVMDKNGTVIEGAAVTVDRNDGTEAFSTTTDASGVITQQDVVSKFWTGPSETETDYSPLVLKITKEGYELYKHIFNAYEKVDWEITLDDLSKVKVITQ